MSEEIYRNFYNYYHPKILFHKEKEKKWVTSFVVSFTGGLGLFLLTSVSGIFTLLAILLFISIIPISYGNWKREQNTRISMEKVLIKSDKYISRAINRERAKDYDEAIKIWEELKLIDEAARVRTLKAGMGAVKVAQSVVQGDQVTKTEIRDSVLNRSNVGGSTSKMQELEKLTEMKEKSLIDDDEFNQMKKEILGK